MYEMEKHIVTVGKLLSTNRLFIMLASKANTSRERLVLRRLVKSVGNNRHPTISLIDRSGEELNSLEYVECFSVYFQTVKIHKTM